MRDTSHGRLSGIAARQRRRMGPPMIRRWYSRDPGLAGLAQHHISRPHPGPGNILVRVEAAALNFSDLPMIDGHYQVRPPRPFIPGQKIAGTVAAAGQGVALAVSDRVMSKVTWGDFSEYALVRADMAMLVPPELP